jgi:Spy/CpxP family protein refolding chaperone
MKITPLRSVTIALLAMAITSYPSITQAAKPSPTPAPTVATTTGKQAPETADQRLAELKQQVNLTKAEETKVKPIVEKYVSDRNAITSDATLSKSDKNSKKDALRIKYNQDINAVLTPDQQQKWAAAKKAMFQPAKQTTAASPSPSPKKK